MTVAEMILRLRERLDDATTPYTTEDSVMFQWLNQAYLRIQRRSQYWEFLHQRGKLFSTVVGTAMYDLPQYRAVDFGTVFLVDPDSSVRTPLCRGQYSFWAAEERSVSAPLSKPVQLIKGVGDKLVLYPTPDKVYEVWGDAWLQPIPFEDELDEPVWADDLHELVWMTALISAVPRASLEEYRVSAVEEVKAYVAGMMDELHQRYLRQPKFVVR